MGRKNVGRKISRFNVWFFLIKKNPVEIWRVMMLLKVKTLSLSKILLTLNYFYITYII